MALLLRNQCAESKSPYVSAHSNNPTAWQLWTPATLKLAKDTNRLLFVSIGYSACHWCHVMAHESFDHPRIAQLLNENFIPVKVDREERPDIDRQYMDFLQATTGGGGWPLNVFVMPDLQPVYGGTYWPGPKSERAQFGGLTFEQVLQKIAQAWKDEEARCRASAVQITTALRDRAQEGMLGGRFEGKSSDLDDGLELDVLEEAYQHFRTRFDSRFGGFSSTPKFPTPANLKALLLLDTFSDEVREIVGVEECADARRMVVRTLEAMAKGGIKDQIGHGFARYSVTPDWSLPHFEKMLYDQGQLLDVFVDAWLLTQSDVFLEMVHDVATYLSTPPMASVTGGINASEDADSLPTASDDEKREGAYYVWTMNELRDILTDDEFSVCTKYWGIRPEGNIHKRYDSHGELVGQNTLCVHYDFLSLAAELEMRESDVKRIVKGGRQTLLAYREKNRPRPALDDKIITAYNGLAVSGLARAAIALCSFSPAESQTYLRAAVTAATFIRNCLFDSTTGTVRRVYRKGPGEAHGFVDDYAFLIKGLIDLYEATFDDQWLQFADKLQQTQIQQFWDEERYAFFSTPAEQPDILVRTKDAMDNAEPSANGVSASNLFRLASLFNDERYEKYAKRTVSAFEVEMGQHPGLFMGMMSSVVLSKLGMKGVMIVGDGDMAKAAVKKARESVRPEHTVLRIGGEAKSKWLLSRNDMVRGLDETKEMVQICEGRACRLIGAAEIDTLLGRR